MTCPKCGGLPIVEDDLDRLTREVVEQWRCINCGCRWKKGDDLMAMSQAQREKLSKAMKESHARRKKVWGGPIPPRAEPLEEPTEADEADDAVERPAPRRTTLHQEAPRRGRPPRATAREHGWQNESLIDLKLQREELKARLAKIDTAIAVIEEL